jgi:hypothetical protein
MEGVHIVTFKNVFTLDRLLNFEGTILILLCDYFLGKAKRLAKTINCLIFTKRKKVKK